MRLRRHRLPRRWAVTYPGPMTGARPGRRHFLTERQARDFPGRIVGSMTPGPGQTFVFEIEHDHRVVERVKVP